MHRNVRIALWFFGCIWAGAIIMVGTSSYGAAGARAVLWGLVGAAVIGTVSGLWAHHRRK